ncbi:transport permease protein [Streptomyces sp. NBRC 14336]|uniref:Transport permease protein n=2 Tax=Actinomycetes TaxID=1760 RepID=A0ABT7J2M6_9ACTN|nr:MULTISPECIES: ABC transporter permease [Streptomyces]WBO77609.1 ABC transporter permease [Streptomyces sp. SBE_14.2]MCM1975351.1 ABC transporter permease [Streptomyces sp. G1]MDL2079118.1 ABC transporter permease [Streptomyces fuscus]SBT93623.1 oleandomycin transport system permease protein [Streptomyces sp. DI166]GLW50640.1 transport permease protein [Streptomyces sp. NBRC 14336]
MSAPTITTADARIPLRGHLRHTGALLRRNLLWIRQDPESMADAVLFPIVFTLLFVYVFGGSIGQALGGGQDAYVQYLVPGMLAMMGMTMAQGVGTGFNQDFNSGVMDRFRSLPIGRGSVLFAKIAVELLRMLLATGVMFVVALLVGFDVTNWGGLLAAVALAVAFGSSLMWVFLTLGVTMKSVQSVQAMGFLVLMPLQFGSSIFAPTDSMPGWLQNFTDYNPLSALADASRGLMNGGPVAHDLWLTLGWSVALTAVMAPIAVHKFRTKT